VLRLLVAVAGEAGELASGGAAGVAGAGYERAVAEPHLARVEPAGEAELEGADQLHERAQAAVVLRLREQVGKPARQHAADQPQELAVGGDPHRRLADGERDELGVRDQCRSAGPSRDRVPIGEEYAATTRASRSAVISSLHLEGHVWKPSFVLFRRVPAGIRRFTSSL